MPMSRVGATETGFSVFAELEGMEGEVEIGTGLDGTDEEGQTRRLRINGTPAKTVDELPIICACSG
jgi:DNA replication and repair protein RecF